MNVRLIMKANVQIDSFVKLFWTASLRVTNQVTKLCPDSHLNYLLYHSHPLVQAKKYTLLRPELNGEQ